jgi:hypothetical protein
MLGANLTYTYESGYGPGSSDTPGPDICLGKCMDPKESRESVKNYDYDVVFLGKDFTNNGRWNSETRHSGFNGEDGTWYDTPSGARAICKYALFKYNEATDKNILVKLQIKLMQMVVTFEILSVLILKC